MIKPEHGINSPPAQNGGQDGWATRAFGGLASVLAMFSRLQRSTVYLDAVRPQLEQALSALEQDPSSQAAALKVNLHVVQNGEVWIGLRAPYEKRLAEVLTRSKNPDAQLLLIGAMARPGEQEAVQALSDLLQKTTDLSIKQAIAKALEP